ncbi:MAG: RDD family protein [Candidatus Acidiferrales bacterium]
MSLLEDAPPASGAEVLAVENESVGIVGEDVGGISPALWNQQPAQPRLWGERVTRGLSRRRRRRSPSLNGNAIATIPDEARWATPTQIEYIGMPLLQSSFDFTAAEQEAEQLAAHASAPLGERLRAALLDAALILLASGFFLGLFAALTGQAGWGRRDILIYLSAGFILAVVYFGMFTVLDGRTPGMQVRGLRVVTFEGNPPAARHRVWRAFGYVVSTGSVLLGFLWAAVDEQQLTWHDRISGTFITDRNQL